MIKVLMSDQSTWNSRFTGKDNMDNIHYRIIALDEGTVTIIARTWNEEQGHKETEYVTKKVFNFYDEAEKFLTREMKRWNSNFVFMETE